MSPLINLSLLEGATLSCYLINLSFLACVWLQQLYHILCQPEMDVRFVTKHKVRSSVDTLSFVYALIHIRLNCLFRALLHG